MRRFLLFCWLAVCALWVCGVRRPGMAPLNQRPPGFLASTTAAGSPTVWVNILSFPKTVSSELVAFNQRRQPGHASPQRCYSLGQAITFAVHVSAEPSHR